MYMLMSRDQKVERNHNVKTANRCFENGTKLQVFGNGNNNLNVYSLGS
jgi:hypothetical protein